MRYRQVASPAPGETCEPFDTLVLDLRVDLSQLFSNLKREARHQIRRAQERDEVTLERYARPASPDIAAFCDAYDHFARSKHMQSASRTLLSAYAAAGLLRISKASTSHGQYAVWHAYIQVFDRARQLHSVSSFRAEDDPAVRALYGRINRLLHWQDIEWFKQSDAVTFDFGGWYSGKSDSARLSINAFKAQFGGELLHEYNCVRALTVRGQVMLVVETLLHRRREIASKLSGRH